MEPKVENATIENAVPAINVILNKAVLEGSLIISAANALNFLSIKASEAEVLKKEIEILKAKVTELETLQKASETK